MYRGYIYKLKPTAEQSQQFAQMAGNARWMWNHLLAFSIQHYKETGKSVNRVLLNREATRIKYEHEWLLLSDTKSFEIVADSLLAAYSHFFRRMKQKRSEFGHPKFKNKGSSNSFACTQGVQVWAEDGGWVKLPKIGWVRMAYYRPLPDDATIKRATVKKDTDGNWYVSILCELPDVEIKSIPTAKAVKNAVGIDLGLTDFATLCWGESEAEYMKIENPRYYRKAQQRLARLQRARSRKAKDSNNSKKFKAKIAKLHFRVKKQRLAFAQYWSKYIADRFDAVCMETLNVQGMKQNRKLSKSVSDAAFSLLIRLVRYKCEQAGKHFTQADRWFASTKLSYWTGERNSSLGLGDRSWTDSNGNLLDRDVNAAMNLRYVGIHLVTTGEILTTESFQALYA